VKKQKHLGYKNMFNSSIVVANSIFVFLATHLLRACTYNFIFLFQIL
jgi:hypothetical protein